MYRKVQSAEWAPFVGVHVNLFHDAHGHLPRTPSRPWTPALPSHLSRFFSTSGRPSSEPRGGVVVSHTPLCLGVRLCMCPTCRLLTGVPPHAWPQSVCLCPWGTCEVVPTFWKSWKSFITLLHVFATKMCT